MLFLALCALAVALAPPKRNPVMSSDMQANTACRTIGRDQLLDCFTTLVDTNHDNILSSDEIGTFLTANNIPAQTVLMRICDVNHDGSLTMDDWNAPGSCAQSQPIITRACYICVRAGWSPLTTSSTTTPAVNKKTDHK